MCPIPEGSFPRAPEGSRVGDIPATQPPLPGLREASVVDTTSRTVPTPGRIVLYRLRQTDVEKINTRRAHRAAQFQEGETTQWNSGMREGDTVPMLIVKAFGATPDSYSNGQVFLDGDDNLWVASVQSEQGDHTTPGTYSWPHELAAVRDATREGPLR